MAVVLPSAVSGLTISTADNLAAFCDNEPIINFKPGKIAPPKYSFFIDNAQSVVAVPKSAIIIFCSGYLASAATALAKRSAPSSSGFLIHSLTPVLVPGFNAIRVNLNYLRQAALTV